MGNRPGYKQLRATILAARDLAVSRGRGDLVRYWDGQLTKLEQQWAAEQARHARVLRDWQGD